MTMFDDWDDITRDRLALVGLAATILRYALALTAVLYLIWSLP